MIVSWPRLKNSNSLEAPNFSQMKNALSALLVLCCAFAHAQTTFTGAVSDAWFEPLNWDNGLPDVLNDGTVPAGLTVSVYAPAGLNLGGVENFGTIQIVGTLTNHGVLNNQPGSTFTNQGWYDNQGTLNNAGTLTNQVNAALEGGVVNNLAGGTMVNQAAAGPFDLDGILYISSNAGTVTNSGIVTCDGSSGTFTNFGTFVVAPIVTCTLSGSFSNEIGGTVSVDGSSYIENHGTFTNAGFVDMPDGGFGWGFDNYGNVVNQEDSSIGERAVRNYLGGTIENQGATGPFSIDGTMFLEFNAGTLINSGTIGAEENSGSFTNTGTFGVEPFSLFTNSGTFDNQIGGLVAVDVTSGITNTGTFENAGVVDLPTGGFGSGFINEGSIVNKEDAFFGPATVVNDAGGMIENQAATSPFSIGGIMHLSSNAGTVINGGELTCLGNDGTLTNSGVFGIGPLVLFDNNGTVDNLLGGLISIDVDGNFNNVGTLYNAGVVDLPSGGFGLPLVNGGTLELYEDSYMGPEGFNNQATGTVTVFGAVSPFALDAEALIYTNDGQINNQGVLRCGLNNGTVLNANLYQIQSADLVENYGTIENTVSGLLDVASFGALDNYGDIVNQGTAANQGTITNLCGSTWTGASAFPNVETFAFPCPEICDGIDNDGDMMVDEGCGCSDAAACNYDAAVTLDDGSCVFPGCTVAVACNYDPAAGCDDGSCEYTSCSGCTAQLACNYNASATLDDGSCDYASCGGCTSPVACNYDAVATLDDGTCEYTTCGGCTYTDATNYDVTATFEDGSCTFTLASPCPTDLNADGQVGSSDLLVVLANFGAMCP